jgi:hypothetical protein
MHTKEAQMNKKVSMNLPQEMLDELADLARARGTTMTQVVKDALAVQRYLSKQVSSGGKILVQQKNNALKELVLLK